MISDLTNELQSAWNFVKNCRILREPFTIKKIYTYSNVKKKNQKKSSIEYIE